MGAGQSIGSHPQPPARALHVLRVTPSSPASYTNIEAFFDFVVGLEGDTHSSRKILDAAELEAIVEKNEGRNLNLLVWNSKSQTTRGMWRTSFHSRQLSNCLSPDCRSSCEDYSVADVVAAESRRKCLQGCRTWHAAFLARPQYAYL
jgi:GRASP55/65 PDZ-like domain-containing protein